VPDDWNPFDSEETRVHYDLAAWSFDQQAELAAELAEADIPHAWDGPELLVPDEFESATDELIEALETRLGIDDLPVSSGTVAVELPDDTPSTEYDLADWPAADRAAIRDSLVAGEIPFRWEGENDTVLVIASDDEASVDELLDSVERGEVVADQLDEESAGDDDDAPLATLTAFFLASDRLQRSPNSQDALEELVAAIEAAQPSKPPFGVERHVWGRACALADEIRELLTDADTDTVAAQDAAEELRDLLRPFV
jgi:hypothetical protein